MRHLTRLISIFLLIACNTNAIAPNQSNEMRSLQGPAHEGEVDSILVAMDAGIYNVKKATCGTYSCETCNGVTDASVIPAPFTVAVGSTTQLTFIETWNTGAQNSEGGN